MKKLFQVYLLSTLCIVFDVAAGEWSYSTRTDEMTSKKFTVATNQSVNVVSDMSFPYNGDSRASLFVRQKEVGIEAGIILTKGQIDCNSSLGCNIRIKFDDKPEPVYVYFAPSTSNRALFSMKEKWFFEDLITAKSIMIEIPMYRDGDRVYKFSMKNTLDAKKFNL